jgi:hypothetical protein
MTMEKYEGPQPDWIAFWQPIETAPKDGTDMILLVPDFPAGRRVRIGHYVNSEHRDHGKVTYAHQYWYVGHLLGGEINPTYWMPLPDHKAEH